ncbi:F0F1 ATP synthase subunit epsilon [Bartonella sp. A05]|uniref:F0F1 ATP synthase subunit epsilon n=1 Tax=Bartonella sp. A05 TaxID=2967261 RepID=UPI0022A90E55|nr:F0F1 ATP synthase subunit epsilon [Bartonella sp. A05]MCZ2203630.1 F0F1 ATP synthase subunit epsilon [Bartonella sp. A05]
MENNRAERFLFELVSPEKLVFSEEVTSVVLPSASGYLTIMAHHAPLMASIVPGSIRVFTSSGEKLFAILGGVVDITSSGCSLLAETVVAIDHLSFEDLERRISQVREMLETGSSNKTDHTVKDFFYQLTTIGGVSTEA